MGEQSRDGWIMQSVLCVVNSNPKWVTKVEILDTLTCANTLLSLFMQITLIKTKSRNLIPLFIHPYSNYDSKHTLLVFC